MIDCHCDTLLKLKKGESLCDNKYSVSFKKLAEYEKSGQVFAVFNSGVLSFDDIVFHIRFLRAEADRNADVKFCITADEFLKSKERVGTFVSVEAYGNTPSIPTDGLDILYYEGVRILGLTWNNDNPLCGGIENNSFGLTDDGRNVVKRICELNIALDVSHISDCGFYDVATNENLNIIATHSNSRYICPHQRNLTDEQFDLIRARKGVVGLNTYPLFINHTNEANVYDLIRHIEHFCAIGGEETLCLGADFDGIDCTMVDICSCEKLYILFDALARLNYSQNQIENIRKNNFIRFLKRIDDSKILIDQNRVESRTKT